MAGLTAEGLDALGTAMLAIPDESMDVSICDTKVGTLTVRTGIAFCVYPSDVLLGGFSPHARDVQVQGQAPQLTRGCRRGDRWGNQAECVA